MCRAGGRVRVLRARRHPAAAHRWRKARAREAEDVATALKLAGGTDFLHALAECQEFQPVVQATIEATIAKIQERWSPRLAVLLMSRRTCS